MRQGLGSTEKNTGRNAAQFREAVISVEVGNAITPHGTQLFQMLQDYVQSDAVDDLVFSNELTNEQRKTIHAVRFEHFIFYPTQFTTCLQLCGRRFATLKTVSIGKDEQRQLTVRKKRTPGDICRMILIEHDGENHRYKVKMID